MGNRLSVRIFAGLCAAALLPLLVAGTLLLPALRDGAAQLRLGSVRTLADSVEPLYGGLLQGWMATVQSVSEDPVLANPAADDVHRSAALRHFAESKPHLIGITLHRATGLALSSREGRAAHPPAVIWARLASGGLETVIRPPSHPDASGADVSLLAPLVWQPRGAAVAEILEFHLAPEALAGPVAGIQSEEVALVDDTGEVLGHRTAAWIGRLFVEPDKADSVLSVPVEASAGSGKNLRAPWRVVVRLPRLEAAKLQSRAVSVLVISAVLGGGVAVLLGWLTIRWLEAPLRRATEAMGRLEQRDFAVRVPESGPVAVAALNRRLNALAKKLEAFFTETQGHRERMEKQLSQEQARAALEEIRARAGGAASRDGFLLLAGEDQSVSWWNARFAQFGRFVEADLELLDTRQVIQRVAWQFADSGRFLEWWQQAASRSEELTSQIWALRQPEDGAARVSAFPVTDAKGAPFGFIWRFEDRTEEARLQRQARDVQRAELIGNLTTGMAHEFNRILTQIVCDMSGLEQNVEPAEREKTIEHARVVASHASAICRGLLGYSRNHLLETRVNSVRSLLAWLKMELSDGLGPEYQLQIELPEKHLHVTADRNRIRSVLLELCGNAIRAMPGGGTLRVSAEPMHLGEGEQDPADPEAGRFVCFAVQDNGRGISDELRARIFEPFFTTDSRASGLGLAAVSGIAWQHGGWLTCSSEEGRGTCMRVYLPASELPVTVVVEEAGDPMDARQVAGVAPGSLGVAVPEGAFVLVVDDEEGMRRLSQAILKRAGIASVGAGSGKEALALYRQYKDRIQVMVLDLNMPGMGGAELFRRLREEGAYVPVIVVSAYLLDFNAFALDSGAKPTGFLHKPYQADQFLQQVSAAMAIAPGSGHEIWARARA